MNAYVNEIYLGQDGQRAVHGFGLASQFYFGKPLAELDLSEIALLVAVVRGPSYYDPRRHPERVKARRDLVLKVLVEQGVIKQADARRCAEEASGRHHSQQQRLLPGLSRLRSSHAAPGLPRGRPHRSRAAHLHEPRSARAGHGGARTRAGAHAARQGRMPPR